ncbi:MAG: 3-deoxy-manno-octulosonate cytidylyltransferase [Alphaproteobacteria bacterium]|nr:3-deoxy-manno-octulosonate cytidylyltransferase [Alphaproteobacteria bacterium]
MTKSNTLVVIPARLASMRLPDKPLAMIGSDPMIVHVWQRAMEANMGPVIVACGDEAIADAVEKAGGTAILTDPDLPSGSDRVWAATLQFDPDGKYGCIVNVQGDLPTFEPRLVQAAVSALHDGQADIGALVAEITDPAETDDPNVVKVAIHFPEGHVVAPALYFSRNRIPSGDGPAFHHIGIYAYARDALKRFVSLPPASLEIRERLEQLRALANGMRIAAGLVDTIPFGVDTPADLERARRILAP